ncbi:50S ribosomal protein L17 [Patescibacteria group bacterium]|nr:50S ribosomal protein L17 [Patescibacteria group bacterium]
MRKQVFGRKFSRDKGSRQALFRSLIKAFIANGKIETTKARAKAISGEIDKIVTSTKGSNIVSAKRKVLSFLANDGKTTEFLFKNVTPAFAERKSGFTKITYLPRRMGDGAEMARLEWVVEIKTEEEKNKKKEKKNESKSKKEVKAKK